jgi:hypothetical protein
MAKHSLGVPGGLIALDYRRSGVCAAEIEENRPSTCGKDGFSSTQSAEAPFLLRFYTFRPTYIRIGAMSGHSK